MQKRVAYNTASDIRRGKAQMQLDLIQIKSQTGKLLLALLIH